MVDAGVIEQYTSPLSLPADLAKKEDGNIRFCVDYRRLDDVTVKDAYQLSRIEDSLDRVRGAVWLSIVGLASGYWRVELDEEAQQKSEFVDLSGLYQFRRMPFGLCNDRPAFELLMELVLDGL